MDEAVTDKVARAGVEAARRKFSPEFINRIDKTVVFHPLGAEELRKILCHRIEHGAAAHFQRGQRGSLRISASPKMRKDFLLLEGTDLKYGARHLKRAVDRNLVHPLSNLMATGQVRGGDLIRVDYSQCLSALTFFKDAEDMPAYVMARMVDTSIAPPAGHARRRRRRRTHSRSAVPPKPAPNGRQPAPIRAPATPRIGASAMRHSGTIPRK